MQKTQTYADIIIPVPIPQLFTYSVPDILKNDCERGKRVIVQFGKKKIYTGIIFNIHIQKPDYQTKDIITVLDDFRIVSDIQLEFWTWISDYYMCSLGEVYKAALPSGLKLESETEIIISENFDFNNLTLREIEIAEILNLEETFKINDLQKKFEFDIIPHINKLIAKGIISANENVSEKFKPKSEDFISLSTDLLDEDSFNKAVEKLSKAPKQCELLMNFVYFSKFGNPEFDGLKPEKQIRKSDLLLHSKSSSNILEELIKKKYLIKNKIEIGRIDTNIEETSDSKELNEYQQKSLQEIKTHFEKNDVVLLHGDTSSGKTEIYIKLIEEQIKQGKQVLYLLPEIALTSQIINRLKNIFSNKAGVYHSKFNDSERVEIWHNLNRNDEKSYQIILGVRSSVFLPFKNLGLIIIDEEHENTYKQYDPAPRYNARDSAVLLAKMHNAKVLMGTATPAFETFLNAKTGKYGLVELNKRFADIELPEIIISDTREAKRKKQMKSFFSPVLMQNIKSALDKKEQIILFQNRRGFSPYLECETCGNVPKCDNCDVSLTYHKNTNVLLCHYCGFSIQASKKCNACGSVSMTGKGFGTEKIEDEIATYFPDAKTSRLDVDTTTSKTAYNRIIREFENKNVDILIGTQMVSKGLDFDNVSVVGIMNADSLLNFPNFRAFERSFQLMVQVSGRAGRKNKRGKVIIQTSDKNHPIINSVISNNYLELFYSQMEERKLFKYPPFFRIIDLSIRHKDKFIASDAADLLAKMLKNIFGNNVLGPEFPLVSRINNYFIKNIIIKFDKNKSSKQAKSLISLQVENIKKIEKFKYINIIFDVDPM